MKVHHGQDEDPLWLARIEDAVGEAPRLASSHFAFEDGPGVWQSRSTTDGGVDLDGKVEPQVLLAVLVVIDGVKGSFSAAG